MGSQSRRLFKLVSTRNTPHTVSDGISKLHPSVSYSTERIKLEGKGDTQWERDHFRTSQIRTPSLPAPANLCPSEFQLNSKKPSPELSCFTSVPLSTSHIIRVPFMQPAASMLPSGDHATVYTSVLCPCHEDINRPPSQSHIFTKPCPSADANCRPRLGLREPGPAGRNTHTLVSSTWATGSFSVPASSSIRLQSSVDCNNVPSYCAFRASVH